MNAAFRLALTSLAIAGYASSPYPSARAQQVHEASDRATGERAMQVTKPSDTEILIVRSFDAPREVVFAALTRPEDLRKWITPANMTLVACEVDLRAGGMLRYVFELAGSKRVEVRDTYTIVNPPADLAFVESYDFSPLKISVVVSLMPAGRMRTVFTQRLTYGSQRERDQDFGPVTTSAEAGYARLDRYLASIAR